MLRLLVEHYGLHREGEFIFLLERGYSMCLSQGFEGLTSPFRTKRQVPCPHNLLAHAYEDDFELPPEAQHPLVVAMAPRSADPKVYWVPQEARSVVGELCKLFSPVKVPVFTIRLGGSVRIMPELKASNITPVIISGYDYTNGPTMRAIALSETLRPIIFCGPFPPACEHTSLPIPDFRPANLPLGKIGWQMLKESVRQ